ncbi:hypothetical protein [Pectobacterium punjabense]|uniref:hypothetical protein n=1 Tax=Pectobacterium punjabense TaxID=2108399 RepID=UPI0024073ED1|nr:hypothetical protein [Pectobacterium punjabense]MDG0795895.1 hypothetical protein [Pectobacterium punjabense]
MIDFLVKAGVERRHVGSMSDIFHFFQPSLSISGAGGQNTTLRKNPLYTRNSHAITAAARI